MAETLPSTLMHEISAEKPPPGYAFISAFTIEVETTDRSGIDQCSKILSEKGFLPRLSSTNGTNFPKPLFKLVATKEYAAPSTAADVALQEVAQVALRISAKLTWTVAQKVSTK
ncbi:MAG: hypothetical protein Q7T25_14270 [Sideroxyarcus sp.]|nr:hypothetical protein [Sideroxyarcus sp.]